MISDRQTGTARNEKPDRVEMTVNGRPMQPRAPKNAFGIEIGALIEQILDHVGVTIPSCGVESVG
jgi:hypothetical protein